MGASPGEQVAQLTLMVSGIVSERRIGSGTADSRGSGSDLR